MKPEDERYDAYISRSHKEADAVIYVKLQLLLLMVSVIT